MKHEGWKPVVTTFIGFFLGVAAVAWILSAPDGVELVSSDKRFLIVFCGLIGGVMGFAVGSEL